MSKWVIIMIIGIFGGLLGLLYSFTSKPKYTAKLSFALIESNSGGLADLASSFGFAGLSGKNDAFSGENLLEIIVSRYAIEKTLLSPIDFDGKKTNLVEVYLDVNNYRKKWENDELLKNLSYPINQPRISFSRAQDSILLDIYSSIITSNSLSVDKVSKKASIVNLRFMSKNEKFSKIFAEALMNQTYIFYKETKISQSKANLEMMQHAADSIKSLYDQALYKGAGVAQTNINKALQYAAVPYLKESYNTQLYGVVYAEVLKNLETLRLDVARETPIIQIIDVPRYPLKITHVGKTMGIIIGGFLSGLFIILYLLIDFEFKNYMNSKKS